VILALGVISLFIALVVPVFERVYTAAGAALPFPTRLLVAVSTAVRDGWPVVLLAVSVCAWILRRASSQMWMRRAGERLMFRVPKLGSVARGVQVTRFVRTFAAMQASGVPVLSGLDVAAESTSDPQMRGAIDRLKEGVSGGRRLSDIMRSIDLFPPMVHRMVAVGEESGRLDALLQRASDLLDRETDYAIKRLMTLAEPLLTLVLGGLVGLVLLALYLPIFGLPKVLLR
jgi:type IV pilus assembly protein PilC